MTPQLQTLAWLNGRLLPETEARIPVTDRAILYGDSLFETIPVREGEPIQWAAHLERLAEGCRITGIESGLAPDDWTSAVEALLAANHGTQGAIRLTLTRGSGLRGYSPKGSHSPNCILTWHPSAAPTSPHRGWHLHTSRLRVAPNDPLASVKHGSRLLQVLARAEAEAAGANEALLLNHRDEVAEASSGNLFWFRGGNLCFPDECSGALAGITARVVRRAAKSYGWGMESRTAARQELLDSDGAFLSLSTIGIIPILSLDRGLIPQHPWTETLARDFLAGIDRVPL